MELSDKMCEELNGAKEYALAYLNYKNEYPLIAKRYQEMAQDEIKHAGYFHDMAVDKINTIKSNGTEYPEFMEEIWIDKHNKYIEKLAIIKNILAM